MGKYQQLINGLYRQGKWQQANHEALAKAGHHAFKPLITALLYNQDDDIRHECAEILGERNSTKAIPYLIEALLDNCLFVRQDALWSIEKISRYQIGGLQDWLDVTNMDSPTKLHNRISRWWNINKRYVQRI